MRFRDLAICSFPRWLPAAILDLIQQEMAPFDPPSPKKTHPKTKHEVDRMMRCWDMAIWSFPRWPRAAILDLVAW